MLSCDDYLVQLGSTSSVTEPTRMKALAAMVSVSRDDTRTCAVPPPFNALFGIDSTCAMFANANQAIMNRSSESPAALACDVAITSDNCNEALDNAYLALERDALAHIRDLTNQVVVLDRETVSLDQTLRDRQSKLADLRTRLGQLQAECDALPAQVNSLTIDTIPPANALLQRLHGAVVHVVGNLGSMPWGHIPRFPHNGNVCWIWNSANAQLGAPTQRVDVDPPVVFQKIWNNHSSRHIAGVMHCVCDNTAKVFLNGARVGPLVEGGWLEKRHFEHRVRLAPGANTVHIEAYNRGGPAGLLLAVVEAHRHEGKMLFCSDGSFVTGAFRR